MMMAIPPNNLDQLISWVRLFAQDTESHIRSLENRMKELNHKVRRMENEQPK